MVMGVEAQRGTLGTATTEVAPVAGESPGSYAFDPPCNHVRLTNETGEALYVKLNQRGTVHPVDQDAAGNPDWDDPAWTVPANWAISGGVAVAQGSGTSALALPVAQFDLDPATSPANAVENWLLRYVTNDSSVGTVRSNLFGQYGQTINFSAGAQVVLDTFQKAANTAGGLAFAPSATFDGDISAVDLWRWPAYPQHGLYDLKVPDGVTIDVGEGLLAIRRVTVWVPAGGDVAGINLRGSYETPKWRHRRW
jgi:hypothetical protein